MIGGKSDLLPSIESQRQERDEINRNENSYIREKLGAPELLVQLAEEASELSHAALKLRRAITGVNPTPITKQEALAALQEEIADVDLSIVMLGLEEFDEISMMQSKRTRWANRIRSCAKGGQENGEEEKE